LIGSSSSGYVVSLLLCGLVLPYAGYPGAFLATAAGPVLAAVIAWPALWSTTNVVHPAVEQPRFSARVLKNRPAMRLIFGYTGHSWELLGMWSWMPAFVAASFVASGWGFVRAAELAAYSSASFHVMGVVSSSSMGWLSDKMSPRTVLMALATISCACSFIFGWVLGFSIALVLGIGALYAFTALGDSPIWSSTLTQVIPPSTLGAALALRSLLGFGAGAIAPLAFGLVLDHTNTAASTPTNWGWAFAVLGLGGIMAVWFAFRIEREQPAGSRAKADSVSKGTRQITPTP
jgi:nitrate/nitrite transporter NarK